jgi:hypothetical protein
MTFIRVILVVFSVAVPGISFAEPAVSDLAARMELRAVETLTLSDQQFLLGDKNGKAAILAGAVLHPDVSRTNWALHRKGSIGGLTEGTPMLTTN